jgi:hypothetical protein
MNSQRNPLRRLVARASAGLITLALAGTACAATFFQETFDSYTNDTQVTAAGWLINDNSATAESDWTIGNPGNRGLPHGAAGKFMVADDDFGSPDGDDTNEELITPAINLATATQAWLHFATFSEPNDNGETVNNVDVSTDGGATWTTVWASVAPSIGTATVDDGTGNLISGTSGGATVPVHINISTLAAGKASVKIRFHHLYANDDWYWIVDNVVVDDQPPVSGTTTILANETFEGDVFPPTGWRIVRASADQANNGTWTRDDQGNCFRNAGGSSGANFLNRVGPDHFAILDSDCDPDADPEDEQLLTPTVNCSTFAKVYLHVDSEIKFNVGKTIAEIEVSRDGGQTFTPLFAYDFRVASPPSLRDNKVYYDPMVLDASLAAGSANVVFRFRYRGNGDEWFWGIDNVKVSGVVGTAVVVEPPRQPTLTAPSTANFFADLALRSSAFSDPNAGDVHASSTWQISRDSAFTSTAGFATPALEVRNRNNLVSVLVGLAQFQPGTTIYASVQHQDQSGLKSLFSVPQSITISPLPAPLFIETFETTADFGVPSGWTVTNRTSVQNDIDDPADPTSNTYLGFVVVPAEALDAIGGGRNDPNVVNGKSLWAESDKRNNTGQVEWATTPDYNLAGKSNIWLVFKSNYEQNQDNVAALEFSTDQGATWLPIVYMIDKDDILFSGGSIDAVATMTAPQADAPQVDDGTGTMRAGTWADFISAKNLADLGPYISGRINDDARESRRIERFRLNQADNKATVRFRFAYAGTSSWWWGIDDFGIFSVEPPPQAPEIVTAPSSQTVDAGASTTMSVSATGSAPLAYAWYKDGALVSGASAFSLTFNPVTANNAGSYVVVVSNAAGSVTSTPPAILTVNVPVPPALTYPFSQWDFDQGDLRATIGFPMTYRGDTATATTFETVKIGGKDATVMKFPAASASQGFAMAHGVAPNGGGRYVNQYTVIYDVMYPAASASSWRVLFQSNTNNSNDGDFFVNPTGGIGISGSYQGSVLADTWHRIAFAVDLTTKTVGKYIDGALVNSQTLGDGVDGRWSLDPIALVFADEDGDTAVGYVNSIQFHGRTLSGPEIAALGAPTAEGLPLPSLTGQWDFNQGDLRATVGFPLEFLGDTATGTTFETVQIGGQDAKVMKFPKTGFNPVQGYIMTHNGRPNGGGTNVNQYSVVMDIMYPATSTGYRALWQTDPTGKSDAEIFVHGNGGIGISSQYQGNVTPDAWHRVVFTFDLTKRELRKYVDGANVLTAPVGASPGTELAQYLSTTSGIVDNRYSLGKTALVFNDEDGETGAGFVNSIQFHSRVLTGEEVANLGTATASGIPAAIVAPLRITGVSASATAITIGISGGVGPFQLQKRATLSDAWQDVGSAVSAGPLTDTPSGSTGFYRVVGR